MKRWVFLFSLLLSLWISAQEKPQFWNEIQEFKQKDIAQKPPQNAILFVGSSSFTKWTDVSDYFPGKTIINRGFGGSSLKDLNIYHKDLLAPYHPKQIVIYCGENDFASNPQLKAGEALKRFKKFYGEIRAMYPDTPVSYISIKMSPSREKLWNQFAATNAKIKNFLKGQKNTEYIDITKAMLDEHGKVRSDLYLEDMLHMKPEGYKIWADVITPHLK